MLTLSNPRREIGFLRFKVTHVSNTLHLCLDFDNTDVRRLMFLFRFANFPIEFGTSPLGNFKIFHLGCELILLLVDVGPRKFAFEHFYPGVLVPQRFCLGEPDHCGFPDVFEIRYDLPLLRTNALRCREVLTDRVVLLLKLLQLRASEEELVWRSINAIGLAEKGLPYTSQWSRPRSGIDEPHLGEYKSMPKEVLGVLPCVKMLIGLSTSIPK